MTEQVAAWFRPGVLIVVGEADGGGIHKRHGQLEGAWRDCVIVELLIEKNSR